MQSSPLFPVLIAGASLVIIIVGVKAAAPLLNTILVAYVLALTMSPLQYWLMGRGLKPGLAVLLTLLVVIIGGGMVVALLAGSLAQLSAKLPVYEVRLTALHSAASTALAGWGVDSATLFPPELFSPSRLVRLVGAFLAGMIQTLGGALLLLFIVIVFLLEFAGLDARALGGENTDATLLGRFNRFSGDTRRYITITGAVGLFTAVGCLIWLLILGVDFAITWSVLAFFLNFVPGIGDLIALIPPLIVTLLEQGWERAVLVAVGLWLINFVGDKVIKPRFMSQGLNISLLLIFLSLLFWAWVLGPAGMFLAVPLTLTIRKFVLHYTPAAVPGGVQAQPENSKTP